jgi:hypothetical protein
MIELIMISTIGSTQRSTTLYPIRAPHLFETDGHLIADTYLIKLHKERTLADHFNFIGENLNETARYFYYLETIHSYRVTLHRDTLHNRVRSDPGVQRVSHDRYYSPEPRVGPTGVESRPRGPLSRLYRRWIKEERFNWWYLSMLSWGRKHDEEPHDGRGPHVITLSPA